MTSISTSASADLHPTAGASDASAERTRRRALVATALIGLFSLGLLVDLLLARHTESKEIVGPIVAAGSAAVGLLSFTYLARRSRSRAARLALYTLWATVAFFGVLGVSSHRQPIPADMAETRQRPPLAPLVFTGMGVMGAINLRSGAKEK